MPAFSAHQLDRPSLVLAYLLPITALCVALGLFHLGRASLWSDEVFSRYYYDVFGPGFLFTEGLWREPTPPTYPIVLRGWMALFGDSEAALRSLSLLCTALSVPLVFRLGRDLGTRREALAAALLFALCPAVLYFAQEARVYAMPLLPVGMMLPAVANSPVNHDACPRCTPGTTRDMLRCSDWHTEGEAAMQPVVIAVAITGSVPRKKDNPAVPTTPAEQVESTHAAFEAGASLVHIHVRNPDESPSSDPALFAAVQAGVRRYCPGMIVQFSTGGRGRDQAARGNALELRPDMASLSTGSVNFPTIVYENSASLVTDLATRMQAYGVRPEIEIFDLSHLHGARRLVDAGLMDERPHVQVVMGVKNALPAEERLLDLMLG